MNLKIQPNITSPKLDRISILPKTNTMSHSKVLKELANDPNLKIPKSISDVTSAGRLNSNHMQTRQKINDAAYTPSRSPQSII